MTRSAALPDVPTVAEAGVPGYEASNWIGLVATGGTPEPIVARLHKEISEILDSSEVQKLFAAEGADVVHMSTAQFGAYMSERDRQMGPGRQAGRHQGAVVFAAQPRCRRDQKGARMTSRNLPVRKDRQGRATC
jgi:hypothetical protein